MKISMVSKYQKYKWGLILSISIIFILGVLYGTKFINPFEVIGNPTYMQVVFKLRMPRMIAAIICGSTLGVSGMLIQLSMNNELADSSILGFQSGATFIALLIMLAFPVLYPVLPLFAFLGGMIVYAIVYTIAKRSSSALQLIVAGIAISSVIRSLISLVSLIFADDLQNTIIWTSGSLTSVSPSESTLMLGYGIVLMLIVFRYKSKLDLLLFDDDYLINLGVDASKIRFRFTVVAILLAAVSVSFVGTIGFVGLLAPHISRRLTGYKGEELLVITSLIGALLVIGCDTAQRIIIPIYEIPVGSIMSLVGGSYLVYLLVRSNDVKVR